MGSTRDPRRDPRLYSARRKEFPPPPAQALRRARYTKIAARNPDRRISMSTDGHYRIERDALGDVRVPADVYYGSQTVRAIENFPISGLRLPRAFIAATATIKRAAAEVNAALGLLEPNIAQAIARAAKEVVDGTWDAQFPIDAFQMAAGTAQNMNANEVIANRARERLLYIGIGGTATGTGLNADPQYHPRMVRRLSELTGLPLRSSGNLFESMQNMADALECSAALRTLAATLTRIANDLRLMAS